MPEKAASKRMERIENASCRPPKEESASTQAGRTTHREAVARLEPLDSDVRERILAHVRADGLGGAGDTGAAHLGGDVGVEGDRHAEGHEWPEAPESDPDMDLESRCDCESILSTPHSALLYWLLSYSDFT